MPRHAPNVTVFSRDMRLPYDWLAVRAALNRKEAEIVPLIRLPCWRIEYEMWRRFSQTFLWSRVYLPRSRYTEREAIKMARLHITAGTFGHYEVRWMNVWEWPATDDVRMVGRGVTMGRFKHDPRELLEYR